MGVCCGNLAFEKYWFEGERDSLAGILASGVGLL